MRKRILNIGVIGCGKVAQAVHIPILRRMREVRVTALAESDRQRRSSAQRLVPAACAFDDFHQLLRSPEVDAVLICLPSGLHAEAATLALNAGKGVYVEKPIAVSLEEAHRVLEAWRGAGAVGMMGFSNRFNPLYVTARRMLRSGQFGELAAVRTVFCSGDMDLPAWKRSRREGGGVILDLAGHHVDLMRFLLDREFTQVFAQLRCRRTEHDTAMLELTTEDGLMVQSFFALGGVEEDLVEFYCEEGLLRVDRYGSNRVEFVPKHASRRLAARLRRELTAVASLPFLMRKMRSPWGEPSYEAALRHFLVAAQGRATAKPDLLDGYRSLAVTAAAEKAAASGRLVEVLYDSGTGHKDS